MSHNVCGSFANKTVASTVIVLEYCAELAYS